MAAHADRSIADFFDSLDDLRGQISNLESVVTRTLQALSQHGVQLSVDLTGLVQEVTRSVESSHRKSSRIIQQLDQQKELVRTTALITSSLELDEVLAEVMDTVIHLTGAERSYLMLRSRTTGELSIRAARNWDRETISQDDSGFSSSIVNSAIEQMKPIVTMNAADDDRFLSKRSVVQHGLRSVICIPLSLRDEIVGVLYADNRIEQGIFNDDDIPLLTAFGTQAAIAIENARQFGRVKNDLQEAQRELQSLKIQIDLTKVQAQVDEITESEYFERLSEAARVIRAQRRNR